MAIREDLLRQEDISEKEVDAILQIAHDLFEKEEQKHGKKSLVVDLEDIPLRFIDQALEDHIQQREDQAAAEAADERKRAKQAKIRRRNRLVLGLGTVVCTVLVCVLLGYNGKRLVDRCHAEVRAAERKVKEELKSHETQEKTFGRLTGTSGDTQSEIQVLERNAKGAMRRVQMAITHEKAMREKLEQMNAQPEPNLAPALSQRRVYMELDLRKSKYRLITVKQDLGQAEAKWRAATETFSGWLAVTLGLTPGPEPETPIK